MKKFFLTLIILAFSVSSSLSNTEVINALKDGGKLVFIRHAFAPGGGDPSNFTINDCSTQRNLDSTGLVQAERIGKFFEDNNILIDQVLSSEWCRCRDTAQKAFGNYQTFDALNSFFSSRFANNKDIQIKNLKEFIENWKKKKNVVFVTHYVVISEVLNKTVSSGAIIVADKNLKVIGTIEIN